MTSHYFIGIKAPHSINEKVEQYRNTLQLSNSYKVLPVVEDLHITLLFIGALSDHKLSTLTKRLNVLSKNYRPFSLSVNGLSFFGSPTGPRVVYLSTDHSKELNALQQAIMEVGSELLDVPASDRFTPHITIAKKRKTADPTFIPKEQFSPIEFVVEHFSLFMIHPTQSPKYEEVQNFSF